MKDVIEIGYGFLTKLVFNFLKSHTIRTVPFGLGIMNVGLTQALQDAFPSIPMPTIRCTSLCRVYICIWGIEDIVICTGSISGLI